MNDLTEDNKLTLIKLVGEKWNTLFSIGNSSNQTEERHRGWMDILQECRAIYNFDPVPGNDWKYLRDNVWKNMRRMALKRKYSSTANLTEVDKEFLTLRETMGEPSRSIQDQSEPLMDDADQSAPPTDSVNGETGLDNSNEFYHFDDATDSNDNIRGRLRSSYRDHPATEAIRIIPVSEDPEPIFVTNGTASERRRTANGKKSKRIKSEERAEFQNDDHLETQRSAQLQNQVLEAQAELLKSQAELAKSQAAYWKMRTEAVRAGLEKQNVVIKLEDNEEDA